MVTPIKRRVCPAYPLKVEYTERGKRESLTLNLVFDFNALALIQERTNLNLLEGEIWKGLGPECLGVIVWAAARARQEELAGEDGLEIVRSYLDGQNSEAVAEATIRAFAETLPESRKAAYLTLLERAKTAGTEERAPDPFGPQVEAPLSHGSSSGLSSATISVSPRLNSES
jgi:hypothetical protein